ncbi:hypothetical protein DL98DRAFT_161459 [Cadophora sp. DSE1049]|nr:hypothetical protein DL98DRAFT_161459 [Cadophora sp. DSE1049]
MRTQSVFSIALVAFTSTLHAAPIQMTEDVKAAMGSVGRNLQMLSGRTNLASLVAANVVRDLQADAAALQAQSDAVHAGDAEELSPAEEAQIDAEDAEKRDLTAEEEEELDEEIAEEDAAKRDLQSDAAELQAQSDAAHAGETEDLTPEEEAQIDAEDAEKRDVEA